MPHPSKLSVARGLQGVGVSLLLAGVAAVVGQSNAVASPRSLHRSAPLVAHPAGNAATALRFEPNRGQFEDSVRYLARGNGFALYLTTDGATLALRHSKAAEDVVTARVVGGTFAEPVPSEPLPGVTNYFVGQDPRHFRAAVEGYGRVTYRDVLPGVDVTYYGAEGHELEYDLLLAPGVDPNRVELAFDGVTTIDVDAPGTALLRLASGTTLRQKPPVAYQTDAQGQRTRVAARYVMHGRNGLGFALGAYDRTRPLVIDPTLSYASYLGASNFDQLNGVATDTAGNTYVVGYTSGGLFPTAAPIQSAFKGGGSDAVVCKLNPSGQAYVYCTYLGGTSADQAYAVAVDGGGNAYVTGVTYSTDFPLSNAFQSTLGGPFGTADAFVTKLNANGSALLFSTYLGGASDDFPSAIAVSAGANARIVGQTFSSNFPQKLATQGFGGGSGDAFVTSFLVAGNALEYSTFVGGNNADYATGIALSSTGDVQLTGWTKSVNFPTLNAFQATYGGNTDAFLTRFVGNPPALGSSSYLGGSGTDLASGIAVQAGSPLVVGSTTSTDFPAASAAQPTLAGSTDGFVTSFTPNATSLIFSTYLGGSADDAVAGVAATADNSYVVGKTSSTNFPLLDNFRGPSALGASDAFMVAYNLAGGRTYSTYLGGNDQDYASGIAVRAGGEAHVVGNTFSADFPVIGAPVGFDTLRGSQDGFIVRSPLVINRIAASAGSWQSLGLLGALLMALGTLLGRAQRQRLAS